MEVIKTIKVQISEWLEDGLKKSKCVDVIKLILGLFMTVNTLLLIHNLILSVVNKTSAFVDEGSMYFLCRKNDPNSSSCHDGQQWVKSL